MCGSTLADLYVMPSPSRSCILHFKLGTQKTTIGDFVVSVADAFTVSSKQALPGLLALDTRKALSFNLCPQRPSPQEVTSSQT